MKDCWPDPAEPDALFGAAVLAFGPVPKEGWSKARDPDSGTVVYTSVRGKAARAFTGKVLAFLEDAVREEYEFKDWTDTHKQRIARRWKNQFFRWLWSQLDDGRTESDMSRGYELGESTDLL
jgi:hypothetical protein